MRHIRTEIVINSDPETVWQKLMDFENYSKWNPFIRSVSGEKAMGEKLVIEIQPPNGSKMTFKPVIQEFIPNQKLKWLGTGPIKGLFDGEHSFQLESQGEGQTKFIHEEKFTGLLVGLLNKTLDKTEQGFIQMNEALKKVSEKTR